MKIRLQKEGVDNESCEVINTIIWCRIILLIKRQTPIELKLEIYSLT